MRIGRLSKLRLEHSQVMVEMALVLPVFLILVMALLDYSRVVYMKQQISHAVREGGRFGVTGRSTYDGKNYDGRLVDAVKHVIQDNSSEAKGVPILRTNIPGEITVAFKYPTGTNFISGTNFTGGVTLQIAGSKTITFITPLGNLAMYYLKAPSSFKTSYVVGVTNLFVTEKF